MKTYSKDELKNINKLMKKVIIINLSITIVLIGLLIFFIIVASRDYKVIFKALLTIDIFIIGSSFFGCFFHFYQPLYILYRHINNIVSSNSNEMIIKVKNITTLSTISSGIKAYNIECECDNKNHILYLNPDFHFISFVEDNYLKVEVANNFIKTYEVLENE